MNNQATGKIGLRKIGPPKIKMGKIAVLIDATRAALFAAQIHSVLLYRLIQSFLADRRQIGRVGYVISHVPFAVLRVGRDILPYG